MTESPDVPKERLRGARIALGTAQFGLDYGVSNTAGQPGLVEVAGIVADAHLAGCTSIDTAVAYGSSEQRLGQIGVRGWAVVSKLPAVPDSCGDIHAWAAAQVVASLQRLGIAQLDALLLHAPQQLSGPRGAELARAMLQLKEAGLARRLGVSVYSPAELAPALAALPVELVQAPFNVIDRSLESSSWAARLRDRGVEVHLRSAFLQGLLLMDPSARPAYFSAWPALWDGWHGWLREAGLSPLQASLSYALSRPFASRIVVGVASRVQLAEVLRAAAGPAVQPPVSLQCADANLVNPSLWKLA